MNRPNLRLAVLHPVVAAQLVAAPAELDGIEVVWRGDRVEDLLGKARTIAPDVVVLDLEQLGDDVDGAIDRILAATDAELVFVVYSFARRSSLAPLLAKKVRVMRAPISVGMLRLQMMSVLVRGMLKAPPAAESAVPIAPPATPAERQERRGQVSPPRFTDAELGRLQELSSAIQCECPNHVASLLVSLRAFERYSHDCEDKDAKDAAVHRMLYERTAAARVILEEALVELLKHEGISV